MYIARECLSSCRLRGQLAARKAWQYIVIGGCFECMRKIFIALYAVLRWLLCLPSGVGAPVGNPLRDIGSGHGASNAITLRQFAALGK